MLAGCYVLGRCGWVLLLLCTIDESGKRKPNTERKEGEDI